MRRQYVYRACASLSSSMRRKRSFVRPFDRSLTPT
jgi:hypothetical protein